jgi:hypothetical protein
VCVVLTHITIVVNIMLDCSCGEQVLQHTEFCKVSDCAVKYSVNFFIVHKGCLLRTFIICSLHVYWSVQVELHNLVRHRGKMSNVCRF